MGSQARCDTRGSASPGANRDTVSNIKGLLTNRQLRDASDVAVGYVSTSPDDTGHDSKSTRISLPDRHKDDLDGEHGTISATLPTINTTIELTETRSDARVYTPEGSDDAIATLTL